MSRSGFPFKIKLFYTFKKNAGSVSRHFFVVFRRSYLIGHLQAPLQLEHLEHSADDLPEHSFDEQPVKMAKPPMTAMANVA